MLTQAERYRRRWTTGCVGVTLPLHTMGQVLKQALDRLHPHM